MKHIIINQQVKYNKNKRQSIECVTSNKYIHALHWTISHKEYNLNCAQFVVQTSKYIAKQFNKCRNTSGNKHFTSIIRLTNPKKTT